MAYVYILYSCTADKFYVGSCLDLAERIEQHKNKHFGESFTAAFKDWELFFSIDNLTYSQSRKIEAHIKSMKSKVYIQNLVDFPETSQKLLKRYK